MDYKIGELAKLSGYSVESIRHYEHIGILASPPRTESGQRIYNEQHLHALNTIKAYRNASFGLHDIRDLLAEINTPHFCDKIEVMYDKYSQIFAEKRAQLDAYESALQKMKLNCENCILKRTALSGKDCVSPVGYLKKPSR